MSALTPRTPRTDGCTLVWVHVHISGVTSVQIKLPLKETLGTLKAMLAQTLEERFRVVVDVTKMVFLQRGLVLLKAADTAVLISSFYEAASAGGDLGRRYFLDMYLEGDPAIKAIQRVIPQKPPAGTLWTRTIVCPERGPEQKVDQTIKVSFPYYACLHDLQVHLARMFDKISFYELSIIHANGTNLLQTYSDRTLLLEFEDGLEDKPWHVRVERWGPLALGPS